MARQLREEQMNQLSQHTIDRYRSLFNDGYSTVTVASVLKPLLSPPWVDLDAKTDFLIQTPGRLAPYTDGFYVGYPDGGLPACGGRSSAIPAEAMRSTRLRGRSLRSAPSTVRTAAPVSTWRFLDKAGAVMGVPSAPPTRCPTTRASASLVPHRVEWRPTECCAVGNMAYGDDQIAGADACHADGRRPQGWWSAQTCCSPPSAACSPAVKVVSERARLCFDREKKLIVHSDEAIMGQVLESLLADRQGWANVRRGRLGALEPIREELRVITEGHDRTALLPGRRRTLYRRARTSSVGFLDLCAATPS